MISGRRSEVHVHSQSLSQPHSNVVVAYKEICLAALSKNSRAELVQTTRILF